MASERTEKCTWPSIKNPGSWVTANQYIMELLFINEARKMNDADLPRQFWKLPQWGDKKWAAHGRAVSKLLKVYEPKAVISAVKNRRLFSLRPKWVENIVQEEQRKLDAKRKIQKEQIASKPKQDSVPIIVEDKRRAQRPSKFASLLALDEEDYGEESSKEKRGEVSE